LWIGQSLSLAGREREKEREKEREIEREREREREIDRERAREREREREKGVQGKEGRTNKEYMEGERGGGGRPTKPTRSFVLSPHPWRFELSDRLKRCIYTVLAHCLRTFITLLHPNQLFGSFCDHD
jgi:hypothetical protein